MRRSTLNRFWLVVVLAALAAPPPTLRGETKGDEGAPATQSVRDPSIPLTEEEREKLKSLTRRSVELVKERKLEEAEEVLREAILLSPRHPVNLYNMACVTALRGRHEAAVKYLELAALVGFVDFGHMERDPDLDGIRDRPSFKRLLARKDELQKRAAQQVVEILRSELGEGYLFEIDEASKLIFATNTDEQTLESLRKWLVAQATSQWDQLFAHRPDQYISVVVPSAKDYRKIVSRPGVGGFYNHDRRVLIAQRLGQVMTHEFTHALHNADVDALGQDHPIWLCEGLGTLFEASRFEGEMLVPGDNFRLTCLQKAAREGRLVPLEELLAMTQEEFVRPGRVLLTYGQAGSLLHFLYEQGLLRAFYDALKESYEEDNSGKLALEKVMRMPLAELEQGWHGWMMGRRPPVMQTGPDGPIMGVQVAQANDGLRVAYVLPLGPAARAGMRVGDVIIGIDEMELWDQQTFLPTLATYEPGEMITVKFRRGEQYMEARVTLIRRDEAQRPTERRGSRRAG